MFLKHIFPENTHKEPSIPKIYFKGFLYMEYPWKEEREWFSEHEGQS